MSVRRLLTGYAVFVCATACALSEPVSLDVQEAIRLGLSQNRDLASLELAVKSREQDTLSAQAAFLPSLAPAGYAQSSSEDQSSASYGLRLIQPTTWGTRLEAGASATEQRFDPGGAEYRNIVQVTLDQPLLRRWGTLVNREPLTRAERDVLTARRTLELRRTDVVVSVAETHEVLCRLQRQATNEALTLLRLERVAELTRVRERQGRASSLDTLRAELKLGTARLTHADTQQALRDRQSDLAELIGLPPQTELIGIPGVRIEVTGTNLAEAVRTALQHRLDYAQILQDHEDAVRGIQIARRQALPDLRILARYGREGDSPTDRTSPLDEDVWFVALAGDTQWPLRREAARVEQARLTREVAKLRIDAVQAAIQRQVQQALGDYARAAESLALSTVNYDMATARVRLARRLFERGRADSFDMAEAEDAFQAAQDNWLGAQSAATTSGYRLLRVLGILLQYPSDLEPPNPGAE